METARHIARYDGNLNFLMTPTVYAISATFSERIGMGGIRTLNNNFKRLSREAAKLTNINHNIINYCGVGYYLIHRNSTHAHAYI